MGILINILIGLGAIIGLLLIIALFTKKQYSVFREIVINRPVAEVYEYVRFMKNQDHYSKWVMTDPGKKVSFRGTDGQVGFVYAWDGNSQAGKGEQEIVKLMDSELVDVEVRFEKPMPATARTPVTLRSISAQQTNVHWGMNSSMKYPMNIMLVLFGLEKVLGKDLEISLNNLKNILEKK